MSDGVQVVFSPETYLMQLERQKRQNAEKDDVIRKLRAQLEYERMLREHTQNIIMDASGQPIPDPPQPNRSRRRVTPENNEKSELKSNGLRKARPAEPIRSYDDFAAIQKYFLDKNDIRDYAMWTVGVSIGVRVSDLFMLRFGNIIEPDKKTFKERIEIYEKKTGKLNDILITESVREAVSMYAESLDRRFDIDGFLFASQKTGGQMCGEQGWRILAGAGRELGLPINIGSHTMRKSFANIAACVDTSCIDMNSIVKIQGLLNHSDPKVTMRYLGTFQKMFDRARIAVSDFALGRSGVNELVAGNQRTVDDVIDKLDELASKIQRES